MLPVAAAASVGHMTARRFLSIGRGIDDAEHPRFDSPLVFLDYLDFDPLAGDGALDEHHATVRAETE